MDKRPSRSPAGTVGGTVAPPPSSQDLLKALRWHAGDLLKRIRVVSPVADLDDLVSAGMIAALAAVKRYDPSRGASMMTFVTNRARGAMLDFLRSATWGGAGRSKARRALGVAQTLDGGHKPVSATIELDPTEQVDSHVDLVAAFEVLKGRERYVVAQYYFADRTLIDIGRDLGVTESRVCQIHRAALSRLRARLDP